MSPVPLEMNASDFAQLQRLPGNWQCADCRASNPDWASPTLGVLLCIACSGQHRYGSRHCLYATVLEIDVLSSTNVLPVLLFIRSALGTHLSFVRSVTMDAWTEKQLTSMRLGGNQRCNDFLKSHGNAATTIREKYDSDEAELYRQTLKAQVEGRPIPTEEGRPIPTELPNRRKKPSQTTKTALQGFGNTPPPSKNVTHCVVKIAVPIFAAAVAVWMLTR